MKVVRKGRRHMIAKEHDYNNNIQHLGGVLDMAWVFLLCVRLFWLLFGVFSYENHEGKPRILF
ncbi:hypothetical protein N665_0237s0054 [Sinapis alba]|nr:hypothetical protein N665_0237s0054 [Sinapis alba]